MEIKMARGRRDGQAMLESPQLLATRNYKVKVFHGTKGVWTLSLAIFDSGTEPNRAEEHFSFLPGPFQ